MTPAMMAEIAELDLEKQFFRALTFFNRRKRGDRWMSDPFMNRNAAEDIMIFVADEAPYRALRDKAAEYAPVVNGRMG